MATPNSSNSADNLDIPEIKGVSIADQVMPPSKEPGEILEFTSTLDQANTLPTEAPELSAELLSEYSEYTDKKGIKAMVRNNDGTLAEGRLIEWDNDDKLRLVWRDKGMLVTNTFSATELTGIPENKMLSGAIDFLRTHSDEVASPGSQANAMLSTIDSVSNPAEEYAKKKGIPVKVQATDGAIMEGRLVEWNNDDAMRIVWREGIKPMTKALRADLIYRIQGNEKVQGAVEMLRANAQEVSRQRSQIDEMLSSVDSPSQMAA